MTSQATSRSAWQTPLELSAARILVVMPSIPVQGMERANLRIMHMMRQRGADVLFITEREYGGGIQREVERIGCRWMPASFARRLRLTHHPREMASVLHAWWKAARDVQQICNVYRPTHIYVTNLMFFLYASLSLYRAPQPVIFRLPNPPDTRLSPMKQRLTNAIWRYGVAPLCRTMVCNSQYTRSQLEKIGLRIEKVRVIYNCVPEHANRGISDVPEMKSEHWNIVFLGRIRPEKGVQELFDAALRIVHERHDIDFYFVGEYHWQNPFAEALIREVEARGLQSRLRFPGQIEGVFDLLSRCDLHVCPSISTSESLPNVILEAKRQGIPSVIFPTAGLTEAVTHHVDGYVCQDISARGLYEGLQYFINRPAALRDAGKAARKSLERFSERRIADAWVDVFKTV